jgi:hypothetical protein
MHNTTHESTDIVRVWTLAACVHPLTSSWITKVVVVVVVASFYVQLIAEDATKHDDLMIDTRRKDAPENPKERERERDRKKKKKKRRRLRNDANDDQRSIQHSFKKY